MEQIEQATAGWPGTRHFQRQPRHLYDMGGLETWSESGVPASNRL